jgi:transaldolase
MAFDVQDVAQLLHEGQTLVVADRVLIDPEPGTLVSRVDELLTMMKDGAPADEVCRTLIRLGMNFVGCDAEIVGYSADEAGEALKNVLSAMEGLDGDAAVAMGKVVAEFLTDMKSVNLGDSLPGFLSERIEKDLDSSKPGISFLTLLKRHMRSSVYWQMIGEGYCKFGNDFARGLEYLRHFGFCQVSTNPVLAAKAFDEDPDLIDALKAEIEKHAEWKEDPDAYSDDMAMAATLIALWPNLSLFRPLALHTQLKDYMVSFQLNPNIADQVDASIEDARNAQKLATNFLKDYDRLLGLGDRSGKLGPCIVFKVSGGHEAARRITTVLNSEGIGTNNTVVYTVAQEIQLILDAFEGKAKALRIGNQVVRTYETNMGGRFVSHLREVEAEKIFAAAAEKAGDGKALEILDILAGSLNVDNDRLQKVTSGSVAEKAQVICTFTFLKTLNNSEVLKAAEAAGQSAEAVKLLEEDLKKAGTLVARRVYWVFYAPENQPKWVGYLQETYDVSETQAKWILGSMDVLPASKRIPDDSYHTLGATNMCNTEFPNHARAVQISSETQGFRLEDFKESILGTYDSAVVERLRRLPDFCHGYDLTPSLKDFLMNVVGIDAGSWQTKGLEPADWPGFGAVQKTSAEFKSAYDTFAAKCVELARAVAKG